MWKTAQDNPADSNLADPVKINTRCCAYKLNRRQNVKKTNIKLDNITKKKEALQKKLQELAAVERKTEKLLKEQERSAKKKTLECNRAALSDLLFRHHSAGFAGVTIAELSAEVSAILDPVPMHAKVEKTSKASVKETSPIVSDSEVAAESADSAVTVTDQATEL